MSLNPERRYSTIPDAPAHDVQQQPPLTKKTANVEQPDQTATVSTKESVEPLAQTLIAPTKDDEIDSTITMFLELEEHRSHVERLEQDIIALKTALEMREQENASLQQEVIDLKVILGNRIAFQISSKTSGQAADCTSNSNSEFDSSSILECSSPIPTCDSPCYDLDDNVPMVTGKYIFIYMCIYIQ
ncbi:uncharacterized protein LOC119735846 [Patiria miniata]|uniref:Uncharacterized protein n=1 Tax=Patiria miniata TaxID=46514 RepID=A0A914AQ01_PATMI|nr:uncharacterized protein LOC119735846 [Patiria miniata]